MSQAPLFIVLHLLGVAVALAIGRRKHPLLACALGFPIGLATAVLFLLLALALGVPYRPGTALVLLVLLMGAALFLAARRGGFPRSARAPILVWTVCFAVAAVAVSWLNLSRMSYDSHRLVFMGRVLGERVELEAMLRDLSGWGPFQVVAHSLHRLTREDYLYALEPMLGLSFVAAFVLVLRDSARALDVAPRRAIVALVSVALFTVTSLHHHFFYIHTNLASAVYLFIFVTAMWRAEATGDSSGLGVGFLALFAFTFQRVEGPLFALVVMTVTVLPSELPRRAITPWLAGFSGAVAGWHLLLAGGVRAASASLTPRMCLAIAALIIAFFLAWLVLGHRKLARLGRAMPRVAGVLVLGALAVVFALDTDHMAESAEAWGRNLVELPIWNQTWMAVTVLLLAGLMLPRPRASRMIAYTIALAFALTLVLAFGRTPYRLGIGDSAERMTVHFVPLLFFYIGLKLLLAVGEARAEARAAPARLAEPSAPA
jgi:hypothetical protein